MATAALAVVGTVLSAYSTYESHKANEETKEANEEAEAEAEQEEADEEAAQDKAVETTRKKAAMRYGISKTIYSSSSGDTSQAATQKKTLLGQ